MHCRSRQLLPAALDFSHLGQFGPAAAAGVGAAEQSAANRAALHASGLKIEEQVAQLLPRLCQAGAVTAVPAVPDGLDQIDEFGAVFLTRLIQLGARLRKQRIEPGVRRTCPRLPRRWSSPSSPNRESIRCRASS